MASDRRDNRSLALEDDDDWSKPRLVSVDKSGRTVRTLFFFCERGTDADLPGSFLKERDRRKVLKPTQDRFESFNDGTPVIDGFRLASKVKAPDKWQVVLTYLVFATS
jgi:hypothetical protein